MNITEKEEIRRLLTDAYNGRGHDLKESVHLAEKALGRSKEINDQSLIGQSLNQLSLYYMIMGAYDDATRMANEAIACFGKLQDEKGIADARYSIAGVYYKTDNYHLGLISLIDCLRTYQKFEDYHNISRVEKTLGTIYDYFGDQNNALKSYENAINAALKTGDQNLASNAYNNLSGLYLKQGKIPEAFDLARKSIEIKEASGDTRGLAFAFYGMGKVYAAQLKYYDAEKSYLDAIKIHTEMNERLGLGMAYHKLGRLYMEIGLLDKAKKAAQEGLSISNTYNIVIIKYKCYYLLYLIHRESNDTVTALVYLELYLKEKEAVINAQTMKVIENYELISKMRVLEQEALAEKEKAEIIKKKNNAEEMARVRQEFLSTMSHEIRTPLNAVTTIVSLLQDQSEIPDRQIIHSLKHASDNLLRIINDILDFTKLDNGNAVLEAIDSTIKKLTEDIRGTYQMLAKDKGLSLNLYLDSQLAEHYELDETKLSQILGNLLSNAIKFTETGAVDIEISLVEKEEQYDILQFRVTDTGEGIPEKDLKDIFDMFSQTKPITTRKQGGTGLGLAIVKKLVMLFGSEIFVESKPGEGSVFYFNLKLKRVKSDSGKNIDLTDQLKGKMVLVAEDNQINAMLVRRVLDKWGASSDLAENGVLAVKMAKEKKYDIILMDIHMPEMNGFDATESIRTQENLNKDTPIFALTADITASQNEHYFSYFNGFLWKPLQIEKLFEALAGVMS